MPVSIDLKGKKFGNLTVIEKDCLREKGRVYWICKCDCGNYTSISSCDLNSGHSKTCGCSHSKGTHITHGLTGTRLYSIWRSMIGRCYYSCTESYEKYGGRGITICDEWRNDFKVFYDWAMANGYRDVLSIDRIDVNGNYEPSNCRWVDAKAQANNTRRNRMLTAFGETKTLAEWASATGISYGALKQRLNRGWSVEEALAKK